MKEKDIIGFLKDQVQWTMGCTDPAAVALAAAHARQVLSGEVEEAKITISPNLYKNAKSVIIPGTREAGVEMALLLALALKSPRLDLTIFSSLQEEDVEEAHLLAGKIRVLTKVEDSLPDLYVAVDLMGEEGAGKAVIAYRHDNLIWKQGGDQVLVDRKDIQVEEVESALHTLEPGALIDRILGVPAAALGFLLEGMEVNLKMAEAGFTLDQGTKIGPCIQRLTARGLWTDDLGNKIGAYTAAACDARMAGVKLPVISSGGSGNQGIVAILPVAIAARTLAASEEKTLYALAISHMVTAYVKGFIGRLSPICGCGVAAGAGAAAGLAYLLGGGLREMEGAIRIVVATLAGMICDGAKVECSLKALAGATLAWQAATLASEGLKLPDSGIMGETLEETLANLERLGREGMGGASRVIIDCFGPEG